jgi:Uncharacterized conserved protein
MLDFQPVSVDDKEAVNAFFLMNIFRNCDFSFSNIFCWQKKYKTSLVIESDYLFIRFYAGGKKAGYMFPLGSGDLKSGIEVLMADAKERNEPFRMYALTREMFSLIDSVFPGRFEYQTKRSWFEYIYNSEDLITLKGKRFQAKRNHVNKFKRLYSYEYLPISRDIIPECKELYDRWCEENGNCNSDESLMDERISMNAALDYFEELGLKGGALRVAGEIVAYSYGQPLGKDTFGVHAEKSLSVIEGGFSMINQQFATHECSAFSYINREEDLGLDSLRQAKMSYHPAILLEKGFIIEE